MKNPKRIAAAMAAVGAYIKAEEEAAASLSLPAGAPRPAAQPLSPWQLGGRQDQMQMRIQMQMKAFHR